MLVAAIPGVLKERLGEDASKAFLDLVKEIGFESEKQYVGKAELLTSKTELKDEVDRINERITLESSKINERITLEIGKLRNEMEKSSKENIRWMFLFWIGQIAVMTAILKLFFK
ncbi:MAG: DUF1640 domain-containing protein [Nitrospirae bacterium]|nr:DUF1640 domain-containing protein [Nitrospirota bacterium]